MDPREKLSSLILNWKNEMILYQRRAAHISSEILTVLSNETDNVLEVIPDLCK